MGREHQYVGMVTLERPERCGHCPKALERDSEMILLRYCNAFRLVCHECAEKIAESASKRGETIYT